MLVCTRQNLMRKTKAVPGFPLFIYFPNYLPNKVWSHEGLTVEESSLTLCKVKMFMEVIN